MILDGCGDDDDGGHDHDHDHDSVVLLHILQHNRKARLREEKDIREFSDVTLHPEINAVSKAVPNRSAETLYLHHELYERRREARKLAAAERELEGCTFKPRTNKVPKLRSFPLCCVVCYRR